MSYHVDGTIRVSVDPNVHGIARKLAQFLVANGVTAAQYNAGKAACLKRAKGEALTAPETTAADRFQALQAVIGGEVWDVTTAA